MLLMRAARARAQGLVGAAGLRGWLAGSHVAAVPARATATLPPQDQVLSGTSVAYLEAMEDEWRNDPSSVNPSLRAFFDGLESDDAAPYVSPPGLSSMKSGVRVGSAAQGGDILTPMNVVRLMRGFQQNGHHISNLDPLGIRAADLSETVPAALTLEGQDLTEADLAKQIPEGVPGVAQLFGGRPGPYTVGEIYNRLDEVYGRKSTIGWDFMHIQQVDRCEWLREKIQVVESGYDAETQKLLMMELIKGSSFESFLGKRFGTEKRFGVDGCEVLIPGMNRMVQKSSQLGVEIIVVGMPHRGRLNVLHNVMKKPMELIFKEFAGTASNDHGSGDVKYHLGMSSDVEVAAIGRDASGSGADSGVGAGDKSVHLSLLANPSHLEAVNPVVAGKARAEQFYRGVSPQAVMPVVLHGDASFAGQGVVYEHLAMTELPEYSTGGTIHIVVNNQVGFTTDPRSSRSTPYCTDIAKCVGSPILHVNGDDVEAVARCFDIAVEWRQRFASDVVIDIVCYRRFGHNEGDEPKFTQPLMYQKIDKQPKVVEKYGAALAEQGVVSPEWIQEQSQAVDDAMNAAFEKAKTYDVEDTDILSSFWAGMKKRVQHAKIYNTGIPRDTLVHIAKHFSTAPEGVVVHPSLKRTLRNRMKMVEAQQADWAIGEALAFGSLLLEDNHVRLSGQDVERGTFSHRHHIVHCQEKDGVQHNMLSDLAPEGAQAPYTVCNSHLSEYGVLGFELGFSMANPHALVCWEAQFGDFANTAQCMIDQFISSGETKWGRQSGLVLLLPHGYEGMGPEHSSARLERFLQLCDDDEDTFPDMREFARQQIERANWQVINPTTPANLFHALRRQVHREFRKPLVVMSPKRLLRHPDAKSPFTDFDEETRFKRLIPEQDPEVWAGATKLSSASPDHSHVVDEVTSDVRRLIFCSGQVYYDLLEARQEKGIKDVALARIEQLSPFPFDLVQKFADNFPNAEITWVQEEPRNQGAWNYVEPRIETALTHSTHHLGGRPCYVGRKPSASTATGDKTIHKRELKEFLTTAFE